MKPQDEIKNLKQQIEEQEGEIDRLEKQIIEINEEIDRLEKQIIEQDERDACLPELVHEALRRVAGFEGDPWATAPSLWVRDLELALFAEISR